MIEEYGFDDDNMTKSSYVLISTPSPLTGSGTDSSDIDERWDVI